MNNTPTEPNINGIFPFLIEGDLDGMKVYIPFISPTDMDAYIESLQWVARKQNCKMDLVITLNGNKVGELKLEYKVH